MMEMLQNLDIDWLTLFTAIWTAILVPIGKQIYDWLKSKKLDKYGMILYEEVVNAVKSVQNAIVDDIKGTDVWDDSKKQEVKELCKNKVMYALSNVVYKSLKEANDDFEEYLDGLIDTVIYDLKH